MYISRLLSIVSLTTKLYVKSFLLTVGLVIMLVGPTLKIVLDAIWKANPYALACMLEHVFLEKKLYFSYNVWTSKY